MNCGEADAECGAGEEHAVLRAAKAVGEELRLAREREAVCLETFLRDRASDNGCGIRFPKKAGGFLKGIERGFGGLVGGLSRNTGSTIAEDAESKTLGQFSRGEGGINDLGADACRIAESDEDFRHEREMDVEGRGGKLEAHDLSSCLY